MGNFHKKTVMIDLDGVLNKYQKFDENVIPEIREGAKEFLEKLYSSGKYELVLFTTRNLKKAHEWLIVNDISMYFADITNIKKPAAIYLDDRALCFCGNYQETFSDIENFQVYWK